MAKGSLFFAKARGKIGQIVLSNVNGQEVARSYNENPANPKTANQMYQRGLFADVVKFYTRGQQNFFKFAFENKKKTESDYNAFVRENMVNGCYLVKEVIDDPAFPKVGSFIMTKGSISSAYYDYAQDGNLIGVNIGVNPQKYQQIGTIGGLSSALKEWNPAIQDGDIITLTTIVSEAFFDNAFAMTSYMQSDASLGHEPAWQIKQFIVDTADTRALSTIGLGVNAKNDSFDFMNLTADAADTRNLIAAACLVVSRNTPTGLKVTTSQLALSYGARRVLARTGAWAGYLDDSYRDLYLKSWGTGDKVILQGSLAKAKAESVVAVMDQVWDESSDDFDDIIGSLIDENAVDPGQTQTVFGVGNITYLAIKGRHMMLADESYLSVSRNNLSIVEITPISDSRLIVGIKATSQFSGAINLDFSGETAFAIEYES